MALVEKVYFPAPPPTSNTLTPKERTALRRSTNKLTRVLGVTPQLLDVDQHDVTIGSGGKNSFHPTSPRVSSRTTTTTVHHIRTYSSGGLPFSSRQRLTKKNIVSPIHSHVWHKSSNSSLVDLLLKDENLRSPGSDNPHLMGSSSSSSSGEFKLSPMKSATPTKHHHHRPRRPPLLRVARSLRIGTQHILNLKLTPSPSSSLNDSDEDDEYDEDEIVKEPSLFFDSATTTTQTLASVRRKKMERLHRLLGEELPISVVFPGNKTDEVGGSSSSDSDSGHKRVRTVSVTTPQKTTTTTTIESPTSGRLLGKSRIGSTRDSIAMSSSSPHHSPRRPHYHLRSSLHANGYHKQLDLSPTKSVFDGGIHSPSLRTIIECPDELDRVSVIGKDNNKSRHTSVGTRSSGMSLKSEWYLSDEEEEEEGGDEGNHSEETLVERKKTEEMVSDAIRHVGGPAVPVKQVWSHKRKPPPVYEP